MRRAIDLSSASSSRWARGSNSIVHFGLEAIAAHHFFQGNGANAPSPDFRETLFGDVDILEILKVLEDSFAGVIGLGAAGAFSQAVEAFFDAFRKADG